MPILAARTYIEYRNDGYWVEETRISLDSIVYAFRQGLSPESIVQSFPLLTLEQVYGAITFYLANRADIDTYLTDEEAAFDTMPQPGVLILWEFPSKSLVPLLCSTNGLKSLCLLQNNF